MIHPRSTLNIGDGCPSPTSTPWICNLVPNLFPSDSICIPLSVCRLIGLVEALSSLRHLWSFLSNPTFKVDPVPTPSDAGPSTAFRWGSCLPLPASRPLATLEHVHNYTNLTSDQPNSALWELTPSASWWEWQLPPNREGCRRQPLLPV